MNLFWKRIFRQLQTTQKMEAQFAILEADFNRYVEIENSPELAEYRELSALVKSAGFKEKKKTRVTRKYKDTEEYRAMKRYNKLSNDHKIQMYYTILENPLFKEYLEFKKTPRAALLNDKNAVKNDPELKRFKDFEQSAAFKNYMRYNNSYTIKELEQLRDKISTPEFQQSNAFWSDPYRWEKTEEAAQERRYNELAASDDIKFFEKTDGSKFARLRIYQRSFYDNFQGFSLATSKWTSGFNYPSDKFVGNHSFVNEKQANNSGENIGECEGMVNIYTRKEPKLALAWDKVKGFVNHQFEYTSDVLNGSKAISQKGGIFRAKIRFEGKDLTQAFWLCGTRIFPHVNIAVCDGKSIEVGAHWQTKFDKSYTSTKVTGLKLDDFYIYSLEWTSKELIWRVNNIEVYRTTEGVPTEALAPMFSAFISSAQKGGEGTMQIDWVEVWEAQNK